jgi:hypothetical protein
LDNPDGFHLSNAFGISNAGRIVGVGIDCAVWCGGLAQGVPEPSTWAMMLMASLGSALLLIVGSAAAVISPPHGLHQPSRDRRSRGSVRACPPDKPSVIQRGPLVRRHGPA